MQSDNFNLTLSGSGYWIIITVLLIFLILLLSKGGILSKFNGFSRKEKWGRIMGLLLFLIPFLYEVSWLAAKAVITVDSKRMMVTKYFLGISFIDNYDISKISNFRINHNVVGEKSNTGNSFRDGIWFERDPTVLYFSYNGTTESIGKHYTSFNADSIVDAVEKEQNKSH